MRGLPAVIPFTASSANAFLLPTDDAFMAVDVATPRVARQMVEYVRRRGFDPQAIELAVATHLHAGHTGGLRELQRLTNCRIAAHRQARRRASLASAIAPRWRLRLRRLLDGLETVPVLHRLILRARSPRLRIDRWLAAEEGLPGDWEVIYTPGHTPESICLYQRAAGILLSGDTLVNARGILQVNPFHADAEVLAMSLLTLDRLAARIVYPGHGRPVRGHAAFEKALGRQGFNLGDRARHPLPA